MWGEFAAGPLVGSELDEYADRWWHPDVVYEEDPGWPGASTYRGRDEVRTAFEGYREVLGQPSMSVDEVIDAGEQVVALIRMVGISSTADVPWDHVWAYRCRIKDGQLVYLRAYWDPEEALAAAEVDSP
jgi:ketosteroid isomerase-like protein